MGGFRAKDADRDRYVDIIEAAYVDGQLGEQDRELRVSRALSAETLDELEALTRDLQPPEGAVVRPPEPSTPAVPAAGRVVAVVFVAVVALIMLGIVATGLMAFSPMDGPESKTSTVEISGEAVPIHYDTNHNPPVYAQIDDPAARFVAAAGTLGVSARIVAPGEVVTEGARAPA